MQTVLRKSSTLSGVAKVVVGESRVKVTLKDKNDPEGEFSGETLKFDREDLPEYVKETGVFYVSMRGDGSAFYGLRPLKGVLKTKFSHFSTRENEPPAPRQETGKFGPYLSFWTVLKVVDGAYKGAEIPVKFIYKFVETDDGLAAIEIGSKKGTSGERLMDFLEIAGVGDVQLRYSDNVLPKLQKALLQAGKVFHTALKDGWADYFMESLTPVAEEDDEEKDSDEDEDEDQQPRKNGKKNGAAQSADDDDEAPKGKLKPVVEDDDEDEPVKKTAKKASKLAAFDDDEE